MNLDGGAPKQLTSPPRLRITTSTPPAAPAPFPVSPYASSSNNTQTGRPSMWPDAAQRQMSRLYCYTTLPLTKIIEVVFRSEIDNGTYPGKDSANKRLNALLNKEPRWIRPRNVDDMTRRLENLSVSPIRSASRFDFDFARPRSASDAYLQEGSRVDPWTSTSHTESRPQRPLLSPTSHVLATFGVTSQTVHPDVASLNRESDWEQSLGTPNHRQALDNVVDPAKDLLRSATVLSTSTTGSFKRVLPNYDEPYVGLVRRLVKQFTLEVASRFSMSPDTEETSCAEQVFPFPLPGHCIVPDLYLSPEAQMVIDAKRRVQWQASFTQDGRRLPWASPSGLTDNGQRILNQGLVEGDFGTIDPFGNTVLHFLAARGSFNHLFCALSLDMARPLLNARNAAGQTFLHLIAGPWIAHEVYLYKLLDVLSTQGFDMAACDDYGRNFFHVLLGMNVPQDLLGDVLQHCNLGPYSKRDAFDSIPLFPQAQVNMTGAPIRLCQINAANEYLALDPSSSNSPGLSRESQFLQYVRLSASYPLLEDVDGRNGLHCLAMATLNQSTALQRAGLPSQSKSEHDSSTQKLEFRLQLAQTLLEAGVDPNHYDRHGNTPLMTFVAQLPEDDDYKTGPKILDLLIKHGANMEGRNRAGETALAVAVRTGRKLAVRTLSQNEDKPANVHVRDLAGRSLLHISDVQMQRLKAEDGKEYAHIEACRAFLSGETGCAVQEPSYLDEWGFRE